MSNFYNKESAKAIKEVAKELGIEETVAYTAYQMYWIFIAETIKKQQLKTDLSDDYSFSINIPRIGKFYANTSKIKKLRKLLKEDGKLVDKEPEEG